jgi:phosphatidylethanolamine-binding protein (PEBP) family uncharacterized protein
MRRRKQAYLGASLLLTLSLTACGTAAPSQTPTAPVATIRLTSPAIKHAKMPARFTCDGRNVAPPLQWGEVPVSVTELAIFAVGVTHKQPPVSIEWVMAGVNPTLHKIAAGALPSGAFLEPTSNGKRHYSICPAKGHAEQYHFMVFALPAGRKAAASIPGPVLLHYLTAATPEDLAPAEGEFAATYKRK